MTSFITWLGRFIPIFGGKFKFQVTKNKYIFRIAVFPISQAVVYTKNSETLEDPCDRDEGKNVSPFEITLETPVSAIRQEKKLQVEMEERKRMSSQMTLVFYVENSNESITN